MGLFNFIDKIANFRSFSFFNTSALIKPWSCSFIPFAAPLIAPFAFPFCYGNSIFNAGAKKLTKCVGDTFTRTTQLAPDGTVGGTSNSGTNSNAVLSSKDNTKFDSLIIKYAKQFGVNPNLVKAIMKNESGFNPTIRSPRNAYGLMQLMPSTAKSLGVDRNNVEDNIKGGVKLLRQLLDRFKGNVRLAVAAYNAGPNRKCYERGEIPKIPETQKYVKKVLNSFNKYCAA